MSMLFHRATGAAAVAHTFSPGTIPIRIHQIKFTLSTAGVAGESLTADIDAGAGAAYDGRITDQGMGGAKTLIQATDVILADLDDLNFTYANSGLATWGIEIAFERVA